MGILRVARVWLGAGCAWLGLTAAVLAQGAPAAEVERLQRDNDTLRQRVQRLEADQQRMANRLAALEQLLAKSPATVPSPGSASPPSTGLASTPSTNPVSTSSTGPASPSSTGPASPSSTGPASTSSTDLASTPSTRPPATPRIQVYGNLEVDVTHDSNSNDLGIPMPGSRDTLENATFNVSAVPSRVGVRIEGPAFAGGTSQGRVEMDFMGTADAGLLNTPRLRHAYMRMDWPGQQLSVLVGKTYDVIGPLQVDSISYPAEAFVGDIGYRRAIVQVSRGVRIGENRSLLFQAALGENYGDLPVPVPAIGDTVSLPMLEVRTALDLPGARGERAVAGLFGHWGSNTIALPTTGLNMEIRTWSIGGDLSVPLPGNLLFMGEIWRGIVLNTYLYGETIDPESLSGQESTGGWASLTWRPRPPVRFNLGGGFDNPVDQSPDSEELQHTMSWFGNVFYDFNKHLEVGFETSYWKARHEPDGLAEHKLRFQGTFMYFF